jgi:hypothetical protein
MKATLPKLMFISGVSAFIFVMILMVVRLWFPQYLPQQPITQGSGGGESLPIVSGGDFSAQGEVPLLKWFQAGVVTPVSALAGVQLLGVSFVIGNHALSRVVLVQNGKPARSYGMGDEVLPGVQVTDIFQGGVRLKTASGETQDFVVPKKENEGSFSVVSPVGSSSSRDPMSGLFNPNSVGGNSATGYPSPQKNVSSSQTDEDADTNLVKSEGGINKIPPEGNNSAAPAVPNNFR